MMLVFPKKLYLGVGLSFIFALSSESIARMPSQDYEQYYKESLARAQAKTVKMKRLSQDQSQALSSSMIKQLYGKYYQVGDSWDVAAFHLTRNMVRKTSEKNQLRDSYGRGAIFHYEVVEVKSGNPPQVVLQVTEKLTDHFPIVDPRVTRMTLTLDDQFLQTKKEFFFKGQTTGILASPNGTHSTPSVSAKDQSVLDLYPLDVPDVGTADRKNDPPPSRFASKY